MHHLTRKHGRQIWMRLFLHGRSLGIQQHPHGPAVFLVLRYQTRPSKLSNYTINHRNQPDKHRKRSASSSPGNCAVTAQPEKLCEPSIACFDLRSLCATANHATPAFSGHQQHQLSNTEVEASALYRDLMGVPSWRLCRNWNWTKLERTQPRTDSVPFVASSNRRATISALLHRPMLCKLSFPQLLLHVWLIFINENLLTYIVSKASSSTLSKFC
jgi:hypothetical protein